jgi:eukaryotic-like serine/threonine-protein kinase
MPLSTGARLGPYEILSATGAGGMGEVYKARDTRLDRTVAIKVLPPDVSADPDRRARFQREAKTIAGLNHPHICTLYDVGEHDGATYLVMEHITGETLAQRLRKGPLPLEQALTVAAEIADALAVAHRQGVIHRDLKPGNVMLTKTGAKLLDFGLAKLTRHAEQLAAAGLASTPTRTAPLTSEGAIVGTLQYMAPEQVEGKPADARTDLWAFGAVLYEMLTGKRAFDGGSAASLIGNIMNSQPPRLTTLQPVTPPALDRLLQRCLAKAPDDRPDTAHDVADDLRWIRDPSGFVSPTTEHVRHRHLLWTALLVTGGLVLLLAGAAVTQFVRPTATVGVVSRLSLSVSPADAVSSGGPVPSVPGGPWRAFDWTPDGRTLVFIGSYAGKSQLYVRRLDAAEARPLEHTDDAWEPTVSADGEWIAFYAAGTLKKIRLAGGPSVDLLQAPNPYPPVGLAWDPSGGVLAGYDKDGIWRFPAEGKPVRVTTVREGERSHTLPSLLPGGRVLLYTVRKRYWTWGDEAVVAQTLATGERRVLLTDAADARYVPATGHLVFLRRGTLYAVAFDAERLRLRGREAPVLEGVVQSLAGFNYMFLTGAGQFAIAPTGTLAWLSAPVMPYPLRRLVTVDRRGQVKSLPAQVLSYGPALRLSPDRRRLALVVRTPTEMRLWAYDLTRAAPLLPLTAEGEAQFPAWGPDPQTLVYWWLKDGWSTLGRRSDDGPAAALLPWSPEPLYPSSVTPDGRVLATSPAGAHPTPRIVVVTVDRGMARQEPLAEPSNGSAPEISPDGRWLLYVSDVAGQVDIYVRPYPGPGTPVSVSVTGGGSAAWHPNGREIFFVENLPGGTGRERLMVCTFAGGSPPVVGPPTELFTFDGRKLNMSCMPGRCYDVAGDGQRFYAMQTETPPAPPVVTHINIVLNWFEELKAKVAVRR